MSYIADGRKAFKKVVGKSCVTHSDIAEPQSYKGAEDKVADKADLREESE